jgi:hypothetical protein
VHISFLNSWSLNFLFLNCWSLKQQYIPLTFDSCVVYKIHRFGYKYCCVSCGSGPGSSIKQAEIIKINKS